MCSGKFHLSNYANAYCLKISIPPGFCHVKTTLCHDITTYDISWYPYCLVSTQLLALVYIDILGYCRYSCSCCCVHNCPLYSKCACSDCPSWISSITIIFQAHVRASCLRLCLCWLPSWRKSYGRIKLYCSKIYGTTYAIYIYIYIKLQLN